MLPFIRGTLYNNKVFVNPLFTFRATFGAKVLDFDVIKLLRVFFVPLS